MSCSIEDLEKVVKAQREKWFMFGYRQGYYDGQDGEVYAPLERYKDIKDVEDGA